jgi:membrane protein required for colicin V production
MNWLDIVIIVCVAAGIIKGLFDGIIKQVISLISLILAIVLSGSIATWIRNFMHTHFQIENSLSPGTLSAVYYILAFVFIITLFAFLAKFVDKIINYTPAGILNRLFGALFGAFMWIICLSILLNILAVFDSKSTVIHKQTQENSIYYDKVRAALPVVYPYIKEFFKS